MTTVGDILSYLETLAPRSMKMDWDNVGLLCGGRNRPVTKVLVALDPFEGVCEEAARWGAELIVTHHPLIFSPLKAVTDETSIGRAVQLLCAMVKNNKPLSELGAGMTKYPQVLLNVRVKDKNGWQERAAIQEVIKKYQDELGDNGQILVRASGTEPLIRIMAEGPNQERLEQIASLIGDVVVSELA